MKEIKTLPRYRCDFCKKTGVKATLVRHEIICWRNPNRYCESCKNKGEYTEVYDVGLSQTFPCFFCSQYDETKLKGGLK